MNRKIILNICFGIGVFLVSSAVFRANSKAPELFFEISGGLILVFTSFLLSLLIELKRVKGKVLLSSHLTFIYKTLLPISVFVISFVFAMIAIQGIYIRTQYLGFLILFIPFYVFFSIVSFKIRTIFHDHRYLHIVNFRNERKIPFENIVGMKRFLVYFMKVEVIGSDNITQKIYFIPHLSELYFSLLFTPKYIKNFKEKYIINQNS
ncbi:MAG: hypothetical protein WBA74_23060 [Cyclobacteriaceae bacterium]